MSITHCVSIERTPNQETKQCVHEVVTKSTNGVRSNAITEVHSVKCEGKRTHFVYNSNVNPSQVDALLAKKLTKMSNFQSNQPTQIKARTVWSRVNSGHDGSIQVHNYERTSTPETNSENIMWGSNQDLHAKMQKQECASAVNTDTGSISTGTPQVTAKVISNPGVSVNMTCTGEDTAVQSSEVSTLTAKVISPPGGHEDGSPSRVTNTTIRSSLNYDKVETKKAALVAPQ